ncbi:hypothetical protein PNK_2429 [Candidatus Protochlamydia naegleriophila]|uniref:NERD domain-containing protein n=1 Tax=Candidatus Protochlamydia naegleriophila TaxID=389348 RepID=A0A0U5JFR3_9BACT|nr:hypothetical protein [Candidatus Protochlamydia naegleriophila]CUI18023.1 hypothetical protein PNK_2429 [Candidatus Protochlamydia naegleriophila]
MSRQQSPILTEPKKNSIDAPTTSIPSNWYEDPNEQQVLLNLLNREGFALEDAVYEALSTYRYDIKLHRGDVFEGVPHRDNDRIEIDLWAQSGNFVFLIESKKSEYDWIFLQNQDSTKDVHIISGPEKTVSARNRILNCVDCVSKQVMEVLTTDDKTSLYRQPQNQKTKNIMLPLRSTREDLARSAIRQALFNLEILMHDQLLNDETWRGQSHRIFIPVVVTNAQLFCCTYEASDINSNADLTKIVLKPITAAAFNHSEILRWGHHYENNLCHIGNPAHISEIRNNDERFKDTHNKTVFVVSKNYLVAFIDKIKTMS